MSSIVDYTDRNTAILFGDAAGAVLLEPAREGYGILDARLYADGTAGKDYLYMHGGGSLNPPTHETVDKKDALCGARWQGSLQGSCRGHGRSCC